MKEVGKIKDACIVIAGQSPKGSSYNENGEGLEFHQGKKAFGKSIIEHSNVWTTEITKIAEPGDILMSVRAPVGPTNITDRRICIGRGLAAIRCKRDIIPQYILYALRNIESRIIGNDGAVFNSINKKQIEDLPLPILPLSEQQSIVDYLDSAFAKIDAMKANAEKALNEAKALFQASLKEMLEPKEGWNDYVFSDLIKLKSGDNLPSKKIVKGSFPVYGGNGIAGYHNQYNKDGINVIIGRVGALCGNVHYITNPFWLTDNGFEVILEKPIDINLKFLSVYLGYLNLGKYARQAAQPVISNTSLKDIRLYIPTLSEQQTIVATLDSLKSKVDRLQENYDKISQECDALKQAILRQVFE